MKKLVGCCLACLLMFAVVSMASAVEVVNLSPDLIQNLKVIGEINGEGSLIATYGNKALTFDLTKNAVVKAYAQNAYVGGYGLDYSSVIWINSAQGQTFSAGAGSLIWQNSVHYPNALDGAPATWNGKVWIESEQMNSNISIIEGPIYIEAIATDDEPGTPEQPSEPNPTVRPSDPKPTVSPSDPKPTSQPSNPEPTPQPFTWFDHNTLGLVGLPLRDLYPDLTSKWYNIVPVDLTVQGRQTYPMAASNVFSMGSAYVDVQGDSVTVTYELPSSSGARGQTYLTLEDECLAWFTSASDITSDFLNAPSSSLQFGESVSIKDTLGGADTALLFICNHVSYRQPCFGDTGYLTRFWPNSSEWKDYRESLTTLLERLPE